MYSAPQYVVAGITSASTPPSAANVTVTTR